MLLLKEPIGYDGICDGLGEVCASRIRVVDMVSGVDISGKSVAVFIHASVICIRKRQILAFGKRDRVFYIFFDCFNSRPFVFRSERNAWGAVPKNIPIWRYGCCNDNFCFRKLLTYRIHHSGKPEPMGGKCVVYIRLRKWVVSE